MRRSTLVKLIVATGLAASCAGAVAPPESAAPRDGPHDDDADRITVTPVVVDHSGRITPAAPYPLERPAPMVDAVLEMAEGEATYYASKFDGRRAASGVVFRNSEAYAAHRTYPFGTRVRVTNLVNDRSAVVRIIDRGPHGTSARARRTIIDLSQSVARELDFMRAGRVPVRVEVLEWGSGRR